MEMETLHICVMVLCTSGLVGGGTVKGLIGRVNVTVRCTDENNSRNEIQFRCNMENLICSSMEVSQEIITIDQSSIQSSSRKLVFRARREGVQNSDFDYYSCQTEDEVNTPAVSTVPDPVTKALPGTHRDTPNRNKQGITNQTKAKAAENKSGSQKKDKEKNKDKPPKPKNCKKKKNCIRDGDSPESPDSGGDGHGNPADGGGGSDTKGDDGGSDTKGDDDETEGDDGGSDTKGDDDETEGDDGGSDTKGGDDETERGDSGSDPDGGDGNRGAEDGTGERGEHDEEVGDERPDNSLVVLRSALGALAVLLLILVVCSVLLWIKRKPQSNLKAGSAGAQQGESKKKVITVYAKATNPGSAAPQPVYNATGHIYQDILDTPQDLAEVIHNSLYIPCEQPSQEQQEEPLANRQYSLLQLPAER